MADRKNWQKRAKTFKQVKYGSPSLGWTSGLEHRLRLVQKYIRFDNKMVLDVGCGVGMFMHQFKKLGARVSGIDADKDKVQIARKYFKNVSTCEAEKISYKQNTFDIVWLHEVIEHVENDKKAVEEAFRVLKPNGKLVIFAPNRLWPFETHGIFWRDKYRFGNKFLVTYLPNTIYKEMTPHVKNYFKKELFSLFKNFDYRLVHYQGVFPGFSNLKLKLGIIGNIVSGFFRFLEKTFLHIFGLSHLVIIEKK
jgi:2-polyprenyl-3-methyl-5-hydroxy-6-metoxy-1,4-benzoquinol methylase